MFSVLFLGCSFFFLPCFLVGSKFGAGAGTSAAAPSRGAGSHATAARASRLGRSGGAGGSTPRSRRAQPRRRAGGPDPCSAPGAAALQHARARRAAALPRGRAGSLPAGSAAPRPWRGVGGSGGWAGAAAALRGERWGGRQGCTLPFPLAVVPRGAFPEQSSDLGVFLDAANGSPASGAWLA